jgi:hypothetical protein
MKWEYRTLKVATTGLIGGKLDENAFTAYMNDLGGQEWELVAAFDTNQSYGATRDVIAVFKRPQG